MESKKVIGIRCNVSDEAHEILNKYVNAKRKRYGLKKDGKKYNMPDAIEELIVLSKPFVNMISKQWESEIEEFEREAKILFQKRLATGS